jgi:hypothetical protein
VSPGQLFTVTALATATSGGIPVAGVTCSMQSPQGASNPLYSQWPSPRETDATGLAAWSLNAPQRPPGAYVIEISAHDQHGSRFNWVATVTLHA